MQFLKDGVQTITDLHTNLDDLNGGTPWSYELSSGLLSTQNLNHLRVSTISEQSKYTDNSLTFP